MTATDNYQSVVEKTSPDKTRDSALPESLAFVYEPFSTWTKFWLGILFDRLLTEVRLILRRVAKYRNPETGATWTGRGKPPNWLKEAEAYWKTREALLIS